MIYNLVDYKENNPFLDKDDFPNCIKPQKRQSNSILLKKLNAITRNSLYILVKFLNLLFIISECDVCEHFTQNVISSFVLGSNFFFVECCIISIIC